MMYIPYLLRHTSENGTSVLIHFSYCEWYFCEHGCTAILFQSQNSSISSGCWPREMLCHGIIPCLALGASPRHSSCVPSPSYRGGPVKSILINTCPLSLSILMDTEWAHVTLVLLLPQKPILINTELNPHHMTFWGLFILVCESKSSTDSHGRCCVQPLCSQT